MNNFNRKIKRTKREQLLLIENMNREALNTLMQQQANTAEFLKFVGIQMTEFQKEILSMKNCLKRRGIITDLEMVQERSAIKELELMQSKAIIIGDKSNG
jgi:hypothetical protein